MAQALPYLKFRTLSFVPSMIATIGFATYRGKLDTVTPLKISGVVCGVAWWGVVWCGVVW